MQLNPYTPLREQLSRSLSKEDLKEICFDVQIEFDDLEPKPKRGIIIEMINRMSRHETLDRLLIALLRSRPHTDWRQFFPDNVVERVVTSHPVTVLHRGAATREATALLQKSNLDLVSFDAAILTYSYPFSERDWGWKGSDVSFEHRNELISIDEMPSFAKTKITEFRSAAANKAKKETMKYCVEQMYAKTDDEQSLVIRARSMRYLDVCAINTEVTSSGSHYPVSRLLGRDRPLFPNMLVAHIAVTDL